MFPRRGGRGTDPGQSPDACEIVIVRNRAETRCDVGLFSVVGKQLQHPRGLLGKVLFRGMAKSTIAHARWAADLMEVDPGDEILEVGFGNGANIDLLATLAPKGHVTGVEVSETALEMASKKNAEAISDGRVSLHLRRRVHGHPHRAERRGAVRCSLHAGTQGRGRHMTDPDVPVTCHSS